MPPKINKSWTYDKECILIDFYRNHDVLWRPSATNHHKAKNSALMDQLAQLLGGCFSVEEIHKRFAALRSTFRENLKRVKTRKSGCSADDVYRPSFVHYGRLGFLADTFYARGSQSTLTSECSGSQWGESSQQYPDEPSQQAQEGDEGSLFLEVLVDDDEGEVEEGNEEPELFAFSKDGYAEKFIAKTKFASSPVNSTPRGLRQYSTSASSSSSSPVPVPAKKAKSGESPNDSMMELARQRLAQPRKHEEKDDNILFGAHVGAHLNKMSGFNAASARVAIEQTLLLYHSDNPNNPNNKS